MSEDQATVKRNHTPSFVNWAKCKKFVLEYSERQNRRHTRVSGDIKILVEQKVREALRYAVDNTPRSAKTVSLETKRRK